jgi:endoribonuclease Dicer
MREYFQLDPPSRRPKVFGMTASPIWNLKDAIGSLVTLEANMDAKVVGVRAHADELAEHSPKPIEVSHH